MYCLFTLTPVPDLNLTGTDIWRAIAYHMFRVPFLSMIYINIINTEKNHRSKPKSKTYEAHMDSTVRTLSKPNKST